MTSRLVHQFRDGAQLWCEAAPDGHSQYWLDRRGVAVPVWDTKQIPVDAMWVAIAIEMGIVVRSS